MREMRYKIKLKSMYSVHTSTYWNATRNVCTFRLKYVILSWSLYLVHTKYCTKYVIGAKVRTGTYFGQKVRTRISGYKSVQYHSIVCTKYIQVHSTWYTQPLTIWDGSSTSAGHYQLLWGSPLVQHAIPLMQLSGVEWFPYTSIPPCGGLVLQLTIWAKAA